MMADHQPVINAVFICGTLSSKLEICMCKFYDVE
jgi:hypothetical protein